MVSIALIGDASHPYLQGLSALGTVSAQFNPALPEQQVTGVFPESRSYNSLDTLLQKEQGVSFVYIHTAAGYHAEAIIKSLQAGKDVICEVPLCITVAAAWQIMETAKFCRRKVVMVNPFRYQPEVRTMRQFFKSHDKAVSSFHISCLLPQSNDSVLFPGGSLLHRAGQFIDLLPWLLGDITEAKGLVKGGSEHEVEHSGAAALELEGGQLGTISWRQDSELKQGYFHLQTGVQKLELAMLSGEGATALYNELYADLSSALDGKDSLAFRLPDALKTVELLEKIYKFSSPAS
jgi:predicted dehydrogenase